MSKDQQKDLLVFLQHGYILVKNKRDFPKAYIKKLLKEAYANSLGKVI